MVIVHPHQTLSNREPFLLASLRTISLYPWISWFRLLVQLIEILRDHCAPSPGTRYDHLNCAMGVGSTSSRIVIVVDTIAYLVTKRKVELLIFLSSKILLLTCWLIATFLSIDGGTALSSSLLLCLIGYSFCFSNRSCCNLCWCSVFKIRTFPAASVTDMGRRERDLIKCIILVGFYITMNVIYLLLLKL